tara:strand:- start:128 stop:229 length:102 start_codon:yes stop_codon:yes gene_type:complete
MREINKLKIAIIGGGKWTSAPSLSRNICGKIKT